MTKNDISESQLVLDLANLRLEVADKEQQLAELRYNRIASSGSTSTDSTLPATNSQRSSPVVHSVPDTPPLSSFPSRDKRFDTQLEHRYLPLHVVELLLHRIDVPVEEELF